MENKLLKLSEIVLRNNQLKLLSIAKEKKRCILRPRLQQWQVFNGICYQCWSRGDLWH